MDQVHGKSSSYVIPNAAFLHGSYIYTDPKGELYDRTSAYFRKNGYNVKVLNLVKPDNSDGFNPLFNIQNEIDVDIIAHTIVKGQGGVASDPYWDDNAEILLKAIIYYLIATRPEEEQNLASAAELVRNATSNGGKSVLSDLMHEIPTSHPARKNFASVEIAPEKAFGSILSTLQARLGKFDTESIAALTSTNTIDFEEIVKKKTVLYVISSDTHGAYDFLLTIFFSQLIQRLYDIADGNGGELPIKPYFFLDEFANIGKIPDFDKKISTSRSRGISFSIILQSLDQLETVYDKSYETIIGNCDTHLFLGSNSQKTVEYFSKVLGEKTIKREGVSRSVDAHLSVNSYSYSDQALGRTLMTPDEIRRMDPSQCIILEKGIKPIKANKYRWYKNRYMKEALQEPSSHIDYKVERGEWRVFDPFNRETSEEKLDKVNEIFKNEFENKDIDEIENIDDVVAFSEKKGEVKESEKNKIKQIKNFDEFDIEKELEQEFDKLFGKLDEEEQLKKQEKAKDA